MRDYSTWQALQDELLLFPQGEHDDLFDGLQTMMEGAMKRTSWGVGGSVIPERSSWWDETFRTWEDVRRW